MFLNQFTRFHLLLDTHWYLAKRQHAVSVKNLGIVWDSKHREPRSHHASGHHKSPSWCPAIKCCTHHHTRETSKVYHTRNRNLLVSHQEFYGSEYINRHAGKLFSCIPNFQSHFWICTHEPLNQQQMKRQSDSWKGLAKGLTSRTPVKIHPKISHVKSIESWALKNLTILTK